MKKQLSMLLMGCLLTASSAWAYDFQDESSGLYFTKLTSSTVEVSGPGSTTSMGKDYTAESYVIPEKVTYDGVDYTVTAVGEYAFSKSSTTSITIPSTVTTLKKYCFRETSIVDMVVPNSVSTLNGSGQFYLCKSLKSISFSENLETLSSYCLNGCASLTELTIPEKVTTLYSQFAAGCTSLTKVRMGTQITTIQSGSFYDSPLTEIYIGAVTPPSLATSTIFKNVSSECVVHVPEGSVDAYKAVSNWTAYLSNFVGDYSEAGGDSGSEVPGVTYKLAGTVTNWADGALEMEYGSDGLYTLTVPVVYGGFKLIEYNGDDQTWIGGDGNSLGIYGDAYSVKYGEGDNMTLARNVCRNVTFVYDPENKSLKATAESFDVDVYFVGAANSWNADGNSDYKFTPADGKYTYAYDGEFTGEFKFYEFQPYYDETAGSLVETFSSDKIDWIGARTEGAQVVFGETYELGNNGGNGNISLSVDPAVNVAFTYDAYNRTMIVSGEAPKTTSYYTYAGSVMCADQPVAGVALTLANDANSYAATSDESGKFSFTEVEAGTYTLSATAEGYEDYTLENVEVDANYSSALVILTAAQTGGLVEMTDTETFDGWFSSQQPLSSYVGKEVKNGWYVQKISGNVTWYASGGYSNGYLSVPYQATLVLVKKVKAGSIAYKAKSIYGPGTAKVYEATQAEDGTFTLSETGNSMVGTISQSGWTDVTYNGVKDGYIAIELYNSYMDNFTNTYMGSAEDVTYTYAGSVKVGDMGIPNASVKLANEENEYSATTDNSGNFSISEVAAGTYTLTASYEGYSTYTEENVEVSANVADKNITLTQAHTYIKGIVYNGDSEEVISGASVALIDGINTYNATTGEDGAFSLEFWNSIAATYTLKVVAEGYTTYTESISPVIDTENNYTVRLQEAISYKLAGSFTNWATDAKEMTLGEDGLYSVTVDQVYGSFKLIEYKGTTATWCGGNGNSLGITGDAYSVTYGDGDNMTLARNICKDVTFVYDPENSTLKATAKSFDVDIYFAGADNEWNSERQDAYKFTATDEPFIYTFKPEGNVTGEFKFIEYQSYFDNDTQALSTEATATWIGARDASEVTFGENFLLGDSSDAANMALAVNPAQNVVFTYNAYLREMTVTGEEVKEESNLVEKRSEVQTFDDWGASNWGYMTDDGVVPSLGYGYVADGNEEYFNFYSRGIDGSLCLRGPLGDYTPTLVIPVKGGETGAKLEYYLKLVGASYVPSVKFFNITESEDGKYVKGDEITTVDVSAANTGDYTMFETTFADITTADEGQYVGMELIRIYIDNIQNVWEEAPEEEELVLLTKKSDVQTFDDWGASNYDYMTDENIVPSLGYGYVADGQEEYFTFSSLGVDGSICLKGALSDSYHPTLVIPVTGGENGTSLEYYVKRNSASYAPVIKFFNITKSENGTYVKGDEIVTVDATDTDNSNFKKFVTTFADITASDEQQYVGMELARVLIDNIQNVWEEYGVAKYYDLAGTVVSGNDILAGVTIKLDDELETVSAEDGSFSFTHLYAGYHSLTVDKMAGYSAYSKSIDLEDNVTDFVLDIEKEKSTFSGYVCKVNKYSDKRANVELTVYDADGNLAAQTTTASNGSYTVTLEGILNEPYTVHAELEGYMTTQLWNNTSIVERAPVNNLVQGGKRSGTFYIGITECFAPGELETIKMGDVQDIKISVEQENGNKVTIADESLTATLVSNGNEYKLVATEDSETATVVFNIDPEVYAGLEEGFTFDGTYTLNIPAGMLNVNGVTYGHLFTKEYEMNGVTVSVDAITLSRDEMVDVYTTAGVLVKRHVAASELNDLANGIYIVRSATATVKYLKK